MLWIIHRVHVYTHSGDRVFVYGGPKGHGENQLSWPQDVCFIDNSYFCIADRYSRRIVIVSSGGERIGFIYTHGEPRTAS